ncbi:MAG: hypothetical protein ABIU05_08130 [Nitrospirales bacterium]
MTKYFTVVGLSAFLVFSGVTVFADQSEMNNQEGQSGESPSMKGQENQGAIESKSQSNQATEPTEEQQKRARPGGVGEKDSLFGSPSTFPPGDTSQGYTGEDKKAEKMEKAIKEEKN